MLGNMLLPFMFMIVPFLVLITPVVLLVEGLVIGLYLKLDLPTSRKLVILTNLFSGAMGYFYMIMADSAWFSYGIDWDGSMEPGRSQELWGMTLSQYRLVTIVLLYLLTILFEWMVLYGLSNNHLSSVRPISARRSLLTSVLMNTASYSFGAPLFYFMVLKGY